MIEVKDQESFWKEMQLRKLKLMFDISPGTYHNINKKILLNLFSKTPKEEWCKRVICEMAKISLSNPNTYMECSKPRFYWRKLCWWVEVRIMCKDSESDDIMFMIDMNLDSKRTDNWKPEEGTRFPKDGGACIFKGGCE